MILADLAAAETRASKSSEAARDDALIFFSAPARAYLYCSCEHCYIYGPRCRNQYLLNATDKKVLGDDFKTVLFVISPVTDTK